MRRLPLGLLLCALLASVLAAPAAAVTGPGPRQAVHTRSYADPFVLRVGATYYAYATDGDFGEIQVMQSSDLVSWTRAGSNGEALDGGNAPSWAVGDDVWAPAVVPAGSGYVLFASFIQRSDGLRCIGRATATSPAGPFRGDDAFRLCDAANGGIIDPETFTSGSTTYLLFKTEGIPGDDSRRATIWSQPLNAARSAVTGSRVALLRSHQPWEEGPDERGQRGAVVENPSMAVVGGRHFLFYSGNHFRTARYAQGYAVCAGPTGPCTTPLNNPLLSSEPGIHGPGGGSVFTDDENQVWLAFAAWQDAARTTESTGQRALYFRRLTFPEGRPVVIGAPARPYVRRIAGVDRYATAAAFAGETVQPNRPITYVATGLSFHDALIGAPASGREGSPVLLVERDRIPDATRSQLQRVSPGHIVLMGGTDAVSAGVESQLRPYADDGMHREAGVNVFHRAALVSRNTFAPNVPVVYVATAANFADALAGGAAGAFNRGPLLFVERDGIPVDPRTELQRLRPQRIVVLGGPAAVSHSVLAQLAQYSPRVDRIAGVDRYETAALVAESEFAAAKVNGSVGAAIVATGRTFPDAVTAGAAGHPVLLVPPTGPIPPRVQQALSSLRPLSLVVMGGPGAVSDETLASIR